VEILTDKEKQKEIKKECKFCGNRTDEYSPYHNVCESCYDEINLENPFGEWIDYD
jgi:uncharacterized OB-fold protein